MFLKNKSNTICEKVELSEKEPSKEFGCRQSDWVRYKICALVATCFLELVEVRRIGNLALRRNRNLSTTFHPSTDFKFPIAGKRYGFLLGMKFSRNLSIKFIAPCKTGRKGIDTGRFLSNENEN